MTQPHRIGSLKALRRLQVAFTMSTVLLLTICPQGGQFGTRLTLTRGLRMNIEGRQAYRLRDVDRLEQVRGRILIAYDIDTHVAWALPEISFAWHLVVGWARQQNYLLDFPFVEAGAESESMVIAHLTEHWNDVIGKDLDGTDITIGDRTKLFLGMIQHRRDSEIARKCETSPSRTLKAFPWTTPKLLAWDINDLVKFDYLAQRRQISASIQKQLWHRLVANQKDKLMICGKPIGTPIRPAPSMATHLCPRCRTVPPDRECFVIMVKHVVCFPYLFAGSVSGVRMTQFAPCGNARSHRRVFAVITPPVQRRLARYASGAVIFASNHD